MNYKLKRPVMIVSVAMMAFAPTSIALNLSVEAVQISAFITVLGIVVNGLPKLIPICIVKAE